MFTLKPSGRFDGNQRDPADSAASSNHELVIWLIGLKRVQYSAVIYGVIYRLGLLACIFESFHFFVSLPTQAKVDPQSVM
jgi:hypothetical protein